MTPTYHLYIDDSGSRDLNRDPTDNTGSSWFALGGILLREEDEAELRIKHTEFMNRWGMSTPLHSYEIRNRKENFAWLESLEATELKRFGSELTDFIVSLPIVTFACVISKSGYNNRYRAKYGRNQWELCKTAFSIVTERAAKFSDGHGRRLKVHCEKSDPACNRVLLGYFNDMRTTGMPFSASGSASYSPMHATALKHILWDFDFKQKSSPAIQLADLVLYPMCLATLNPLNPAYVALKSAGRLIDCHLHASEIASKGIKYSCYD